MKKILALTLVIMLVLSLGACSPKEAVNTPNDSSDTPSDDNTAKEQIIGVAPIDWAPYDELIKQIKSETDMVKREALMHEAEDMLMGTYATIPLYYYNDIYMQKDNIKGIYTDPYNSKYFKNATGMKDGALRINLASEPQYLDPTMCTATDNMVNAKNTFIGLMGYGKDGEIFPEMAESYEVSEDGLTYTFKIREGLKWSDGTPLTAHDVVYSWNRAVNPATTAEYEYMFSPIDGYDDKKLNVTASEDGLTLTVILQSPCAYFLDLCAFATFMPVNQANVEAFDESNPGSWAMEAGFVCSGPFMLDKWNHDESMVYVKNPNYYRADEVTVDRLEFMLSANDAAIFAAFQAGNLDFIDLVPADEIESVINTSEFYTLNSMGPYYICFNVKSELFKGKTVEQAAAMREAVSLLIDREYIVSNCSKAGQIPANTFVPPVCLDGHGGEFRVSDNDYTYPVKEENGYFSIKYTDEKVKRAIELLKSAGFEFDANNMLTSNTPYSFEYLTNENSTHSAIAQAVQQDLALVGINMTIKSVDWNVFLDERHKGNFDVARHGWTADFNDPINFLELFTTTSGNNDAQLGK